MSLCVHMDTARQNLKVQLRGLLSLYNASCCHICQWLSASLWSVTGEGSSVMPIRNCTLVTPDLLGKTVWYYHLPWGIHRGAKKSGQLGFAVQFWREFRGGQSPADLGRQPMKKTGKQHHTAMGEWVKTPLLSITPGPEPSLCLLSKSTKLSLWYTWKKWRKTSSQQGRVVKKRKHNYILCYG